MKRFILVSLFALSVNSFASTVGVESHGDYQQERKCLKEIRALGCDGEGEKLIVCIDNKIQQLSSACQTYHQDEKQRMAAHGD